MKTLLQLFTILSAVTLYGQTPSYVPTNDLVAWYPFSGNTDDQSGHGFHLQSFYGSDGDPSPTSDRYGNSESAYEFDGVDDNLSSNSNASPVSWWNAYTISAWVKVEGWSSDGDGTGIAMIRRINSSGATSSSFGIHTRNSKLGGRHRDDNDVTHLIELDVLDPYSWNHLVIVWDYFGMYMYVNGDGSQDGVPISFAADFYRQFDIGFMKPISGSPGWFFNGSIDDIGIWKRALGYEEILELYESVDVDTNTTDTTSSTAIYDEYHRSSELLKAYPNPSAGLFSLEIEVKGKVSYTVVDSRGREIVAESFVSSGSTTRLIDLSAYSSGIYTIRLNTEKGVQIDKLIKQNGGD